MTNADLAKIVDTSDEWIVERSGIRQRHIAADDELTSTLGIAAAHQALVRAAIDPVDIDLVICATATPDRTFPGDRGQHPGRSRRDQGRRLRHPGRLLGLRLRPDDRRQLPEDRASSSAPSSSAPRPSRAFSTGSDRSTCVLFGDGAGAVVLEAQPQHGTREDRGILATRIRSDGRFEDLLYVDGGPGSTKTVGHLRMNGREVFRHAVQKISGVIEETLVMTGYAPDEIDLYVPHQANVRILDGIAKKLGVDPEKIVMTLAKHGNTSAASIPLALNQAFEEHRVKEGSLVLMEAMGGGFTWGAVLARW